MALTRNGVKCLIPLFTIFWTFNNAVGVRRRKPVLEEYSANTQ